jgi:glyoxylase-like metal-dependent hydrolase (beta-lactamase superfamily II)
VDSAAVEALDAARAVGIHCLPVPTPFAVGTVNAYLVEGDPLTLVDSGPNSATALSGLERGLQDVGYALSELELLVVTHQHMDHMGLAGTIVERSGARVACLGLLAPVLEDWTRHAAQDDDDAYALMLRHGVSGHVAEALHAMAKLIRGWGASSPVDRLVRDGETLALGAREVQALHRPGHSPSDTLLHDARARIVIAGDHLLARVSSNAAISRPLGDWDGRRPKTLTQYRQSLRETRAMDVDVVLGGHGGPVTDHRALIDDRLRQQDHRAERVLELLADGPCCAHELATMLWGQVAVTQAYLTLSEVLGHLDLLISDGRVVEERDAEVIRFHRV